MTDETRDALRRTLYLVETIELNARTYRELLDKKRESQND